MIDAHCHLDLFPKPADVIREVVRRQIYVIAVTTTPKAYEGNLRLVGNAKRIRVAAGLHPELVAQRENEIPMLCEMVSQTKYVGEVGIDGTPQNVPALSLQKEALRAVFHACRRYGGRVVSLHSRMAAGAVLDELERSGPVGNPILHWFSGTEKELERAIELGCWFSVGPAMLGSKKGRSLLARMPSDRILTETDGPFAEMKGRQLHPWDVSLALTEICTVFRLSMDEVHLMLSGNLRRLVSENVSDPVLR